MAKQFTVRLKNEAGALARLAGRLYGPKAGLLAALALNVTGYYGIVAGSCALPDGPLVFFWLLTLERLAHGGGPQHNIGRRRGKAARCLRKQRIVA